MYARRPAAIVDSIQSITDSYLAIARGIPRISALGSSVGATLTSQPG
jgi:hypothetical protein